MNLFKIKCFLLIRSYNFHEELWSQLIILIKNLEATSRITLSISFEKMKFSPTWQPESYYYYSKSRIQRMSGLHQPSLGSHKFKFSFPYIRSIMITLLIISTMRLESILRRILSSHLRKLNLVLQGSLNHIIASINLIKMLGSLIHMPFL